MNYCKSKQLQLRAVKTSSQASISPAQRNLQLDFSWLEDSQTNFDISFNNTPAVFKKSPLWSEQGSCASIPQCVSLFPCLMQNHWSSTSEDNYNCSLSAKKVICSKPTIIHSQLRWHDANVSCCFRGSSLLFKKAFWLSICSSDQRQQLLIAVSCINN